MAGFGAAGVPGLAVSLDFFSAAGLLFSFDGSFLSSSPAAHEGLQAKRLTAIRQGMIARI
jgi:hypothetical protein